MHGPNSVEVAGDRPMPATIIDWVERQAAATAGRRVDAIAIATRIFPHFSLAMRELKALAMRTPADLERVDEL